MPSVLLKHTIESRNISPEAPFSHSFTSQIFFLLVPALLKLFFKTCTAFSKLNFLSFTFCGDRAYGAYQCWGAQHWNPGIRAAALALHSHNTKPWFPLHRPAHMLVNPCSASLHQVYLQGGSTLVQKRFTCATTKHRKNSHIWQKLNLTREGRSNIVEWQTKG